MFIQQLRHVFAGHKRMALTGWGWPWARFGLLVGCLHFFGNLCFSGRFKFDKLTSTYSKSVERTTLEISFKCRKFSSSLNYLLKSCNCLGILITGIKIHQQGESFFASVYFFFQIEVQTMNKLLNQTNCNKIEVSKLPFEHCAPATLLPSVACVYLLCILKIRHS